MFRAGRQCYRQAVCPRGAPNLISIRSAVKSFSGHSVLNGIDLNIKDGELVFVIGRSGTGKSVLLKAIVGLVRLDSGSISVGPDEVTELTEQELHAVRQRCGYVFQQPALLDSLTVYENLAFGLRAHRLCETPAAIMTRIHEVLSQVHLPTRVLPSYPPELSFAFQKRASIARALALSPKYLLFDEPTTGLDPALTVVINQLISELRKNLGVTALVVSHDLHCALEIADRIVLLDQGQIVLDATPEQLKSANLPLAQKFLREARARQYG